VILGSKAGAERKNAVRKNASPPQLPKTQRVAAKVRDLEITPVMLPNGNMDSRMPPHPAAFQSRNHRPCRRCVFSIMV
jgi:hypothetical protein